MRSLAGLAAIVAAASVYLYLLSTHLPPGPKQLQAASEGEDEGVEEYRFVTFFKLLINTVFKQCRKKCVSKIIPFVTLSNQLYTEFFSFIGGF